MDDEARCLTSAESADPVPEYGRFCGVGRPLEADWEWATGPDGGPMDAFDALCMHVDYGSLWYPEVEGEVSEACILRYGLTFARLTRDGVVLPPESADYIETMGRMGNLSAAMANDAGYVAACDDDQLDEFVEATRAKE